MFKLTETHRFWWPCTASVPSSDKPGVKDEQTFTVLFEALSRDRAGELEAKLQTAASARDIGDLEIEQIVTVVRGWKDDVVDADGAPIPFGEEVLRLACQWGWFRDAVSRGYREAMLGGAARAGN